MAAATQSARARRAGERSGAASNNCRARERSDLAQTRAAAGCRRCDAAGVGQRRSLGRAQASAALERLKEAERGSAEQSGRAERDVAIAAAAERSRASSARSPEPPGSRRRRIAAAGAGRATESAQGAAATRSGAGTAGQRTAAHRPAGEGSGPEDDGSGRTLRDRAVRDRIRWSRSMMRPGCSRAMPGARQGHHRPSTACATSWGAENALGRSAGRDGSGARQGT